MDYDKDFVETELGGKSILEIGGFPGVLASLYIARGCKVVAIDSPQYRPDYYLEFAKNRVFQSVAHDINLGPPPIEGHFDAAVMSDVLLHNAGFPSEFMGWAIEHCDKIYILNYPTADGNINPPAEHSLFSGFPVPNSKKIATEMERLGAKISCPNRETGGRELMVFERI